ncbi:DUF418 domain-containing protein [Streptomyces fagopyri]|uniref:DUF418 domain-containing protein n=1 Tax=Streptomyces fagopyri TaxID=2662397 RepID=UPI00369197F3
MSPLTAPELTASYACGLLLLLTGARPAAARVLAASGRMVLTQYLSQSLALAFVLTGHSLGLHDRVGTAVVLAGCALPHGSQLTLESRLMERVRYGPAELVLRTVTLGRRPGRSPSPGSGPAAAEPLRVA